jgi:2-oxo-4-hydroxy-4-carboxy-5-ureidoimidazoline decarboxylase
VDSLTAAIPFDTFDDLLRVSEASFAELEEPDCLEAFSGHPKIGERGDAVSSSEQAGVADASGSIRDQLAEINRRYEERFGFIFIVHATGKSAEEMLDVARGRLENTRDEEVANATGEQALITATRLRRMTCQASD